MVASRLFQKMLCLPGWTSAMSLPLLSLQLYVYTFRAGPWQLTGYYRNGQRPKDAFSLRWYALVIRRLPPYYVRHSQNVRPRFPQSSLLDLQKTGIPLGVFMVLTPPNRRRFWKSSTGASKSPLLTLSRASSRLRRRHEDDSSIAT
jgi:hypothetical protein